MPTVPTKTRSPGGSWRARRLPLLALTALAATLLAACGDDDDEAADPGPPVTDITIVSEGLGFDVEAFAVPAGEQVTVTYDNRDQNVLHNVRFDVGGGDDPMTSVEAGPDVQTITFAVDEPGTYSYVCDVHVAQMRGTLTVE